MKFFSAYNNYEVFLLAYYNVSLGLVRLFCPNKESTSFTWFYPAKKIKLEFSPYFPNSFLETTLYFCYWFSSFCYLWIQEGKKVKQYAAGADEHETVDGTLKVTNSAASCVGPALKMIGSNCFGFHHIYFFSFLIFENGYSLTQPMQDISTSEACHVFVIDRYKLFPPFQNLYCFSFLLIYSLTLIFEMRGYIGRPHPFYLVLHGVLLQCCSW